MPAAHAPAFCHECGQVPDSRPALAGGPDERGGRATPQTLHSFRPLAPAAQRRYGLRLGGTEPHMGTTVAMDDVMEALELATDEASSYVNKTTGQVLTVNHEHLRLAEEDEPPEGPDWEQQAVAEAKQVLDSDQWLKLPSKFDIHEWQTMDDFAASLSSEAARDELRGAIRGAGAFRNFKGAIDGSAWRRPGSRSRKTPLSGSRANGCPSRPFGRRRPHRPAAQLMNVRHVVHRSGSVRCEV